MLLPALKNAVPTSLDGQSIEDYIRNATANLRNVAAAMPNSGSGSGSGSGNAAVVYLGFNGNTGVWKLDKAPVDPESLGRILVPQHDLYEGMIEWANGSVLQKCRRPLRGVAYDEPMTEQMFKKPLSPGAYRKDTDGPKYMMGFIGLFFDDGTTVVFDHSSGGGTEAIHAVSTAALQAVVAFGEIVHPVIELGNDSYDTANRTVHKPKLNVIGYVTDKRAREVDTLADSDIITRPTPSKAKLRREAKEGPAL